MHASMYVCLLCLYIYLFVCLSVFCLYVRMNTQNIQRIHFVDTAECILCLQNGNIRIRRKANFLCVWSGFRLHGGFQNVRG